MEILIALIVCALTSLLILTPFGKGALGFLVGLILGPFGIVVALVERSNLRRAELDAQHRELLYAIRGGQAVARTPEAE